MEILGHVLTSVTRLNVAASLSPLPKCALLAVALLPGLSRAEAPAFLQDASGIGIRPGVKAPRFELQDQSGRKRTLASLMERRGLVLVFFRSADW